MATTTDNSHPRATTRATTATDNSHPRIATDNSHPTGHSRSSRPAQRGREVDSLCGLHRIRLNDAHNDYIRRCVNCQWPCNNRELCFRLRVIQPHTCLLQFITTYPTNLNSISSVTPEQHKGVIIGSAIGATLFVLILISGLFVYERRKARRRVVVSAPRSEILAGDDRFDLEGSRPPMSEGVPSLRPRGAAETSNIFREDVWPPTGEPSRLKDRIMAGRHVDLTAPVSNVMTGEPYQHERQGSGGTAMAGSPLLRKAGTSHAHESPLSPFSDEASRSAVQDRSWQGFASDHSGASPFGSSGLAHNASSDTSARSPRSDSSILPPGAALPYGREKTPSGPSISTTGSPPSDAQYFRDGTSGPSGLGLLTTPENPLTNLTLVREERQPPQEIPPLYSLNQRNPNCSWRSTSSVYSQASNARGQMTS